MKVSYPSGELRDTPTVGAAVSVQLSDGSVVPGAIVTVHPYSLVIRYTEPAQPHRAAITWTHSFHCSGRRMGDHDDQPVRFLDQFGAGVDVS